MRTFLLLFGLIVLFFSGCSRGIVRKDVTVSWDKSSLTYNYEVFRSNMGRILKIKYVITNQEYLSALSNEFAFYDLSHEQRLSEAAAQYLQLTNQFFPERGFLFQRMGVCYFKNRNYQAANKYINLAILENVDNSELSFYKAMLLAYYNKDPYRALKWLKKVDLSAMYLHKQDVLAFEASLNDAANNHAKADEKYRAAIQADPQRFYKNYDLTYFYENAGMRSELSTYLQISFSQLTDRRLPKDFKVKGYRQLVYLNRMNRMESLEYRFRFSGGFVYYPNILYYYESPRPIDRIKSFFLQIPIKDKRSYSSEKVFYPVFEDNIDLKTDSSILLGESMMSITNMNHPFFRNSATVTKILGTNSVALVLSPSNVYIISTNASLSTNSRDYVVSNQSNLISMKQMNFTYYMDTEYFDVDRNSSWDYLFFGFNKTNQAVVSMYDPERREWKTVRFFLRRPDAEFVIQDVNYDGRNEMLLLDDDAYFLSSELLP